MHIGHSQIVSISLDPIHELQTPSFCSFSTVLRHVVLGRPFFHLPSGAHVNATFPSFSWSSLSIRPIILHLLALTFFSVILFRPVHEGLKSSYVRSSGLAGFYEDTCFETRQLACHHLCSSSGFRMRIVGQVPQESRRVSALFSSRCSSVKPSERTPCL